MRVDGERQNMIDFMRLFLEKRSSSFFQVIMAEKNSPSFPKILRIYTVYRRSLKINRPLEHKNRFQINK